MEVNLSHNNEFGVNWHAPMRFSDGPPPGGLGSLGGPGSLGFAQSAYNGGISPTLTALSPEGLLGIAQGSVVGLVGRGINIPVGDSSVTLPSFGVVLKWLQTSRNAQILSTPHILTTDNEEATIEVGKRVPFRRGTSIPSFGGAGLGGIGGAAGGANPLAALQNVGSLFSAVDRIDVKMIL